MDVDHEYIDDVITNYFSDDWAIRSAKLCVAEILSKVEKGPKKSISWSDDQKKLFVMNELEKGGWELLKHIEDPSMTDEWNENNSWQIKRQTAPYCSNNGTRFWFGRTAYDALKSAMLDLKLPEKG